MNNRKKSKKIGDRLRHLSKDIKDPACQGEALEIIKEYGNNPDVVNATGVHGWSPIFNAVYNRNTPISHALMHTSALNVNLCDAYGYSLIMHAMNQYRIDHELIKYLLSRDDVDANFKSYTTRDSLTLFRPRFTSLKRGVNALWLATTKKELFQYIPELLDKMNHGINDYATELVLRSSNEGRRKTINEHGSGADDFIYKHLAPLTNLVDHLGDCNQTERAFLLPIIQRIATSPQLNTNKKIKIQPKDEALLMAARSGDAQLTEILVAAGANTQLTDNEGQTAEELARYCGHHDIAIMIANSYALAPTIK